MTIDSELDEQGQRLLVFLVEKLKTVVPDRPNTYVGYKAIHDALGLSQLRERWGESLQLQGLNSLAIWTADTGKPGITGIIVDQGTLMPGDGYFKLFGKTNEDFGWWSDEVKRAKGFDWSPWLQAAVPPETPAAADIDEPAARQGIMTYRILRDTALARSVKEIHNYECQLCGHTINLPDGTRYAEAHHIRPLGTPHDGPDRRENIICLCPNHHAELDYGVQSIDLGLLCPERNHGINQIYVDYHNENIFNKK